MLSEITHGGMNDSRGWRFVRLAVVIVGAATLMGDYSCLREDEIDCEKAVAWLQTCCPGFAQHETLQCVFSDTCGVTEPAISISDSQCILGEGCEELQASGICERAQNLKSPSTSVIIGRGGAGGSGPPAPNMVCP
jgi:hypothetical protein